MATVFAKLASREQRISGQRQHDTEDLNVIGSKIIFQCFRVLLTNLYNLVLHPNRKRRYTLHTLEL